jgi:hypothetical protein
MKIAICFWGLCRSTNYVIDSIKKHLFDKLKEFEYEYDVYLHTHSIQRNYTNQWSKERNIKLNNDLWQLLEPKKHIIEDQDEVDRRLELSKYRRHGCPWRSPDFETLNNSIRALYSLKQVTELMLESGEEYDYVIFSRPDVFYLRPLMKEYFTLGRERIHLPHFAKFPINDRFAICKMDVARIYGLRFNEAFPYSLYKPLHSESYLSYILKKNDIVIYEIPIVFFRVRADGRMVLNKIPY